MGFRCFLRINREITNAINTTTVIIASVRVELLMTMGVGSGVGNAT
jgi:hypothetical protein